MKRNLAIGCGLVLIAPLLFTIGTLVISSYLAVQEVRKMVPEGADYTVSSSIGVANPREAAFFFALLLLLFISGIVILVRYGKKPSSDSARG